MTSDEVKNIFAEAVELFDKKVYAEALSRLDVADKYHPNSRHINFYRALCLAKLDRVEEAVVCKRKIQRRLKPADLQQLNDSIDNAAILSKSRDNVTVEQYDDDPSEENIFTVQSVFSVSTDECSVTGTVDKGVFHVEDRVHVIGPDGAFLSAPIMRIGADDAPLSLAREGQRVMLLIPISPEQIQPGASIKSKNKRDSHTDTTMAGPDALTEENAPERSAELTRAERLIKRNDYLEADRILKDYAAEYPESLAAKRMLAQLYLEKDSSTYNPAKALLLIQMAHQSGIEDTTIVNLLATAHAENGHPQMGLRFLEGLFGAITEAEAKQALSQRIQDFRSKYDLGELWEFANSSGEIIFKSNDLVEVVRAVVKGAVPLGSTCRHNLIGDFTPIETALPSVFPEVAAFFMPKEQQWSPKFLLLLLLLVLAILLALIVPILR